MYHRKCNRKKNKGKSDDYKFEKIRYIYKYPEETYGTYDVLYTVISQGNLQVG